MSLDEEALQVAAKGGLMDFDKWAGMLDPLLERLDHIVYHVFPMPKVDPPSKEPTDPQQQQQQEQTATPPSSERVPDSQPQSFAANDTPLPPPLALLLNSTKSTLRSLFMAKPPHTIQRLAELILHPNLHYRTLPAYLRALDRVVCVTSSAEVFQLQNCQPNGVVNGATTGPTGGLLFEHAPGSDEALGGALLTPIPWLGSLSFEGDAEGDPVPIAIHNIQEEQVASQDVQEPQDPPKEETITTHETTTLPSHSLATETETAESDELPHARGPPVVGVEDMGLQDGKGVEMPLEAEGGDGSEKKADGDGSTEDSEQKEGEGEGKDGDGDISLGDAKKGKA